MNDADKEKGISLEVLGTCMTNTTPDSQHKAAVEYWHLWSFAQEAALVAVCDKDPVSQCYKLIEDPERRAKRIAGHYADMYFKSAKKSGGKIQMYWTALAAFVVKDVVEAFRFSRDEVLNKDWQDVAKEMRTSWLSDVGSWVLGADAPPLELVIRTYAGLAKGNLWLFMDIYPWMWFFLEYGIRTDATLAEARIQNGPPARDWASLQRQSKAAVEELPFGSNWLARVKAMLDNDPVKKALAGGEPALITWIRNEGYRAGFTARTDAKVKQLVPKHDQGLRTPPGKYWKRFSNPYLVLEAEREEMGRIVKDAAGLAAVESARNFKATAEVQGAYQTYLKQYSAKDQSVRLTQQKEELKLIATHEQCNVLQPLIYNDAALDETLQINHTVSRLTGGWLTPQYKVVYSASPKTDNPKLQTVFDAPEGAKDRLTGPKKRLANQADRMEFVEQIAKQFNDLMETERSYMEGELRKIQAWRNA